MNDRRSSVLGFLARMCGDPDFEGAKRLFEAPGETAGQHRAEVESARAVTPIENAWLKAEVARDGKSDECEEALLRFLREESGQALS
jgi:hypothetical protein